MTAALDRAAAMPGLRQVYLGVNAQNTAAIALYESLGFSLAESPLMRRRSAPRP